MNKSRYSPISKILTVFFAALSIAWMFPILEVVINYLMVVVFLFILVTFCNSTCFIRIIVYYLCSLYNIFNN